MPSRCPYCQKGFNERLLLPPAKPQPGSLLAQKIGTNADPVLEDLLKDPDSWPDDGEKVIANLDVNYEKTFAELTGEDESLPMGMGDVLNCDFAGFDLDQELKEGS